MKASTVCVIADNLINDKLIDYMDRKGIEYYECNGKLLKSTQVSPRIPYTPIAKIIADKQKESNIMFIGCAPSKQTMEIIKDFKKNSVYEGVELSETIKFDKNDVPVYAVLEDTLLINEAADAGMNVYFNKNNKRSYHPVIECEKDGETIKFCSYLTEADLAKKTPGKEIATVEINEGIMASFRSATNVIYKIRNKIEKKIEEKEQLKIKLEEPISYAMRNIGKQFGIDPTKLVGYIPEITNAVMEVIENNKKQAKVSRDTEEKVNQILKDRFYNNRDYQNNATLKARIVR